MEYKRAEDILPKELLKELQFYIEGATLYIPKSAHKRQSWGEKSGTKEKFQKRNREIKEKFQSKNTITSLAQEYFLSEETVRKIVYKK
ncbi:CD3324 family protein [Vagococcus fluvialis]|uniref:CD3324 family protein n=1 Tax=Vagococcus fluvialis TaxID=2738 RepID=UPI003B5900DB